MKQIKKEVTIQELYDCYYKGKLKCNPAYQRDYIAHENKPWQRKLMDSVLKGGRIIPALYLRSDSSELCGLKVDKDGNVVDGHHRHRIEEFIDSLTEVVDGQQRLRTIVDFIDGKFKVTTNILWMFDGDIELVDLGSGYTFEQLQNEYPDIARRFLNTQITIIGVYSNNEQEIIQLFRDLNDLNDMSNQEIRNCTKDYIGVWIRDTARLGESRKKKSDTYGFHKLFERNEDNQQSIFFNGKFKRMLQDELLAKIFCVSEGIALTKGWDKTTLDMMYKNTDYKLTINEKKMTKLLNTLYDMLESKQYRKLLNTGTVMNLVLLTNYIIDNKEIKVKSWSKLLDWFFVTHKKLKDEKIDGTESDYSLKTRLGSDGDGVTTRLNYLLHELPNCSAIQSIDAKRVITDWEAFEVWINAGRKCVDCGDILSFSEMVKAHGVAHSNGGETTIENTKCSCKDCNKPEIK